MLKWFFDLPSAMRGVVDVASLCWGHWIFLLIRIFDAKRHCQFIAFARNKNLRIVSTIKFGHIFFFVRPPRIFFECAGESSQKWLTRNIRTGKRPNRMRNEKKKCAEVEPRQNVLIKLINTIGCLVRFFFFLFFHSVILLADIFCIYCSASRYVRARLPAAFIYCRRIC